ncbi:hypothetical protein [Cellulosimicrobium sp. CUA-896]|uniref:hypothetical protein n=1 Tax=Cellulosimicrobium sp. CUA-896 TaxID=1517881 RepID=UPI0011150F36|nr:hypothetical protein [Cellulosimicrobium sp. CUA-896]
MRHATRTPALAASALVSALLLAACSGSSDPAAPTSSGTGPSRGATPSSEPDATDPASEEPAPAVPTDLPAEALLPAAAWEASGDAREESEGAAAWRLPDACGAEPPADVAAMLTVAQGDGAAEGPVGVQQVAVFPDADAPWPRRTASPPRSTRAPGRRRTRRPGARRS